MKLSSLFLACLGISRKIVPFSPESQPLLGLEEETDVSLSSDDESSDDSSDDDVMLNDERIRFIFHTIGNRDDIVLMRV